MIVMIGKLVIWFSDLGNGWGPHIFDRFAANYNNKCMRLILGGRFLRQEP